MAKYNLLNYLSNTAVSSGLVAAFNNQAPCGGGSPSLASSPFHPDGSFTFSTSKARNQKRSCQRICFEKYPWLDYSKHRQGCSYSFYM